MNHFQPAGFFDACSASLRANASFNFEADSSYTVRIRTTDQALAMLEAGATRLGCSATREILAGVAGTAIISDCVTTTAPREPRVTTATVGPWLRSPCAVAHGSWSGASHARSSSLATS